MNPAPGQLPIDARLAGLLVLAAILLAAGPLRLLLRRLLGPLFALEMGRLARSRRLIGLRVGYAVALLAALFVGFPDQAEATPEEIARFAQDFSELFLIVQSITVMLLTPLVFGGAISDEREAGSLDFLLATTLSTREIILGKYAARVLVLTMVMMTGVPILALSLLFGGVDLILIASVFAVTYLSMLSFGAGSLLLSVICRRTVTATGIAYAVIFGLTALTYDESLGFLLPLSYQRELSLKAAAAAPADSLQDLSWQLFVHSPQVLGALFGGIVWLRPPAGPRRPPRQGTRRTRPAPPLQRAPLTEWQPIGRLAIAWKERFLGRRAEPLVDSLWLYGAVIGLLFGMAAILLQEAAYFANTIRIILVAAAGFLTAGLSVALLLQAAGTLTREREQRTLESLLALPESRTRILGEKLLGALLRHLRWLIALAALLLVGLISGMLSPSAALALALLALAQAALVTGISLLASLVSRTTMRAYVSSAVAILLIISATGVVARYQTPRAAGDARALQIPAALNPIAAWQLCHDLSVRPPEERGPIRRSLLAGIGATALTAALLFAATIRRFRRGAPWE